jgi:hypothetical protein
MNDPEFEIGLHQRDTASYAVQMRFHDPTAAVDQRDEAYPVRFPLDELRACAANPTDYGLLLGRSLLGHDKVRSCLDRARAAVQTTERRLRLRLCIERWSSELHGLRWETLRDPQTGRSLLTDDNILFSRHLGSFDMRPVRLRSKTDLRALVAVANPSDLGDYRPGGRALAPIDVAAEVRRAREGLDGISVAELAGSPRVTLGAILDRLRDDYDILYLACHGALIEREPRLWLEGADGGTRPTSGQDLVDGLARLHRLPRLVVLASCQGAGTGQDARSDDEGVLAALGPRLAEAGVPAVVAMQGNVFQRTVARFMPVFFRELRRDGRIDRAMGQARFEARDEPDHWAPVLYTRLVSGRLWYEQRFGGTPGFDAWPGLINQIRKGKCVPILGSGLLEPFIGSPREIARRWATKFRYPLTASLHDDLPQVAQYLSTTQGTDFPRDEFVRELADEVVRRWPEVEEAVAEAPGARVLRQQFGVRVAPPPVARDPEDPAARLLRLLSAARAGLLRKDPAEPHQVLARLSCPIYITTNPDDLLADALRATGKEPREELCRWQKAGAAPPEVSPAAPFAPVGERPLVYQLFGHLRDPDSMVLTEEDYFHYLIGITLLQSRPKPSAVHHALADSGLMFLGFRIDDWDFRVFVHFLRSQQGAALLTRHKHVAVQLDPEEGLGADPAQARRYLEKYFGDWKIEIYWGSVEDFVQELNKRWPAQT